MNPSGDAMGMQLFLGTRLQVDVLFGCFDDVMLWPHVPCDCEPK